MARIDALFNLMFEQKASDLHLSSGNPPILRINGELTRVDLPPLEDDQLKIMLYEIAPEYKIKVFEETGDVDFGYEIAGVSRFRANFFTQKYGIAAVFRQIPSKVLSFEDFDKIGAPLPAVLKKFAMLHKGLVVVTGPTGSGKSTTLAAIVDYANKKIAATTSSPSRTLSNSCTRARNAWLIIAKWDSTPVHFPPRFAAHCAKTRTSSSSANCATWKQSNWR